MKYASKTDIGKRIRNEDALRIPVADASAQLIAVADGMGGHAAGALASSLALEVLGSELAAISLSPDPIGALKSAIQRANVAVFRKSQTDLSLSGMGTTLICALLSEKRYIAANIGDSRLYHYDGEALVQVSHDHSYVEMLVQAGSITREEARFHPQRNLITRAMGLGLRVEIDIFDREWRAGDMLLLCSDGLSGSVSDMQIQEILSAKTVLEEKCDALVALALENGGSDNITVVLACCEEGDCA